MLPVYLSDFPQSKLSPLRLLLIFVLEFVVILMQRHDGLDYLMVFVEKVEYQMVFLENCKVALSREKQVMVKA